MKQTFILTTIHTTIKVLTGLVMNKILAIYLNPSGLALIGQFQNITGILSSGANGSIQTGIVKKTAEFNSDKVIQKQIWGSALIIGCVLSILTMLGVILFRNKISLWGFRSIEYGTIIGVFGVSIGFYVLNLHILSILNGLGNIKLFSVINIIISVLTAFTVILLTYFFRLKGAMIGLILTQSFVFFISLGLIYSNYKFSFFPLSSHYVKWSAVINLFKFGTATFLSGQIASIMMICIRLLIVNRMSLVDAGIWESAFRIGLYFNMVFALPISIYFLPKFSEIKDKKEIKKLMLMAIRFFVPIILIAIVVISYFKLLVIHLLFSPSFLSLSAILTFVLFGEVCRITSSIFSCFLFAKQKLQLAMRNESIFGILFVLTSYFLIDTLKLKGIAMAYVFAGAGHCFLGAYSFYAWYKTN